VSLTINNMPQHNHPTTVTINAAADGRPSSPSPAGAVWDSIPGEVNYFAAAPDGTTTMNAGAATAVNAIVGGGQPINVQNPFLGMIYIIAIEGIFPSRG
jgi:microcystin-dependent protein